MKLVIDIADNKADFGLKVLRSLDFVKKIETQNENGLVETLLTSTIYDKHKQSKRANTMSKAEKIHTEHHLVIEEDTDVENDFERKWNDPTNLTPEQLSENLKARFAALWNK